MAGNTIMTAKNSFSEGLLMDFSPDNTQANCMTSALNATLLTFNGNEMALLNDMGNGRVETAYLPEGYIPVGTCEFGDIIYIISYNPLTDKALIGCFPSPERNISSEELNNPTVTLKSEDFQEFSDSKPTGNLKASSVKKILFLNDLHPGDKFIIASSELQKYENYISAYGSTKHDANDFPKLVKIHVVSIEESGKINYLDSSVKWYNEENPYFISNSTTKDPSGKLNIESYRNLVSSGYSVFNSKTSGQLALLIELEKITGFNCTWECFKTGESTSTVNSTTTKNTDYSVYLNFSWNTNHNDINPFKVILEESEWKDGTYKSWKKESGSLYLSENCTMDNKTLPTTSHFDITRHYCPEDEDITYDDYCEEYKYESVVKNFNFSKILRIDENGIPTDNYAMNCDKIENNNGNILYKTLLQDKTYRDCVRYSTNPTSNSHIYDSIINNKFKYPITKKLHDFTIPTHTEIENEYKHTDEYGNPINENGELKTETIKELKKNDIKNLIYHYKVVPAMPYGKLSEFAQEGYIDFSKIDTEFIKLHTWKYYGYENTMTLNWGLDAYTDPGKVITDVLFEFYNDLGLVGRIVHPNYISYNGSFTDYIVLNKKYGNGNITDIDSTGNLISTEGIEPAILNSDNLYLVKIIITQGIILATGDITSINSDKIEYRWIWTNSIFNQHYLNILDFDNLNLMLDLDCDTNFTLNVNCWKAVNSKLENPENVPITDSNIQNSLAAKVLTIKSDVNSSTDRNVIMRTYVKLKDTYGIFDIDKSISNFKVIISEGNQNLINIPEQPKILFSLQELEGNSMIYPVYNSNKFIGTPTTSTNTIYSGNDIYKNYYNTASLVFPEKYGSTKKPLEYVDLEGNHIELDNTKTISITWLSSLLKTSDGEGLQLGMCFNAIHYSKYYYYTGVSEYNSNIVRPCLLYSKDLDKYNLSYNSGRINFNKFYYAGVVRINSNDIDNDHMKVDYGTFTLNSPVEGNVTTPNIESLVSKVYDLGKNGGHGVTIADLYNDNKDLLSDINLIFPFTLGVDLTKHDNPDKIIEYINKKGKIYINEKAKVESTTIPTPDSSNINCGVLKNWILPYTINSKSGSRDNDIYKNIKIYTLGYKHKDGIKILNMWRNSADNTNNIDTVLSLLTQVYYKTADLKLYTNNYKLNYVYLEDNYMLYSRDIVVKVNPEGVGIKIKFKNSTLEDYVNKIKAKCNNATLSQSNITPTFNSCIKSFPVQFKIYYQPPTFESKPELGGSVVQSYYQDMPKLIQQDLQPGTPYVFDGTKFVDIASVEKIFLINNLTFNSDSLLNSDISLFKDTNGNERNTYLSLEHINGEFYIENNILKLRGVPSSSSNYYDLVTTASSRGKDFWGNLKTSEDTGLIRITECNDLFNILEENNV